MEINKGILKDALEKLYAVEMYLKGLESSGAAHQYQKDLWLRCFQTREKIERVIKQIEDWENNGD